MERPLNFFKKIDTPFLIITFSLGGETPTDNEQSRLPRKCARSGGSLRKSSAENIKGDDIVRNTHKNNTKVNCSAGRRRATERSSSANIFKALESVVPDLSLLFISAETLTGQGARSQKPRLNCHSHQFPSSHLSTLWVIMDWFAHVRLYIFRHAPRL